MHRSVRDRRPSQGVLFAFPSAVRRSTRKLLQQQCWCWGADIRAAGGNLLLEYGLARTRTAFSSHGTTSRYSGSDTAGSQIHLWGFGAMWSEVGLGTIYLDRQDLRPAVCDDEQAGGSVFESSQVHGFAVPTTWHRANARRLLFVGICRWIARYERWVVNQYGLEYRDQVIAQWKAPVVDAAQVATTWSTLADEADRLLSAQLLDNAQER